MEPEYIKSLKFKEVPLYDPCKETL